MGRRKVERGPGQARDIAESWARERPDAAPEDYLHLIYVLRLGRILEKADDERCRARTGLSGAEMRVLFSLRRAGAPYIRRMADLFRAVLVSSGTITKQVDRLEKLGYVQRISDPDSNGGTLVGLTPAGHVIADDGLTALIEYSRRQDASILTSEERRILAILAEKFLLEMERSGHCD